MSLQNRFILGGIAAVLALFGLVLAARAEDPGLHVTGLIVTLFGLLFCAFLIKDHYDRLERDPARPKRPRFADPAVHAPAPPPSYVPAAVPGQYLPAAERPARMDAQTRAWIRGGIVGVVGLLGLVVAASGAGFAYWGGLLVFTGAVLLLFRMIGRAFDPPGSTGRGLPLPRTEEARWALGGLIAVIVVLALFAARGGGDAYYLGLIAAGAALAYLFWLIKASFDEAERA